MDGAPAEDGAPAVDGEDAGDAGAWTGSAEQVAFAERVLAAHIARSSGNGRRPPQRDLRPDELACIPDTTVTRRGRQSCVETATATAAAAGRMLAAATTDLAKAQQAGDEDALRTVRVTAVSGYRSSGYQRRLWLGYFGGTGGYYNQTRTTRAAIPDGPHSDAAVDYLLRRKGDGGFGIGARIAAPGYSNHQNGIAVDLLQERTAGHGIRNSSQEAARARWRDTWFHRWLRVHAAVHYFEQLASEEWHWEYKPAAAGGGGAGAGAGAVSGAVSGASSRTGDDTRSTAVTTFEGGRLWTFRARTLGLPVSVFCPPAALGRGEVDLVLFAHGLLGGCPRPRQLPAGFVTDRPFSLGRIVAASGRPAVLAVPLLDWANPGGEAAFGPGRARWHALARPENLDALVGEVLAELGRTQAGSPPALHELVVAGHSRAYDLLEPIAAQHTEPAMTQGHLAKLRRIWAFDTTYAGRVGRWTDWVQHNQRLQVQLFYRPGTPTAAVGDAFYQRRGDRLVVTRVTEGHCAVPATRMPALLGRSDGGNGAGAPDEIDAGAGAGAGATPSG